MNNPGKTRELAKDIVDLYLNVEMSNLRKTRELAAKALRSFYFGGETSNPKT